VKFFQAVGIAVEFCSHLIHSFALAVGSSKKERALFALTHMGSSVCIICTIIFMILGMIGVVRVAEVQVFFCAFRSCTVLFIG